MEKDTASEPHGLLLAELARVQELARKTEAEHNQHSTNESYDSLLRQMLASIDKSICLAMSIKPDGKPWPARPSSVHGDSPRSSGESSRSESSRLAFKDQVSKKRKKLPKWTREVRVGSGAGGAEGLVDDGYSWRKYGRKDILGAQYPRGYYRCTHRITQGCPATKQVQRSDEDALLFHVTYHGTHTCLQRQQVAPTSARLVEEQKQKEIKFQEQRQQNQDLLLSFQTGLRVKTGDLDLEDLDLGAQGQTSLSFPFASPSTPDNCFISRAPPTFLSPATSDSFSLSPCGFGGGIKLQSPESGVTAVNSATDSPFGDMDFVLPELDLETDFSSFFSLD